MSMFSCSKDDNGVEIQEDDVEELSSEKQITDFVFSTTENEKLSEDIRGVIDEENRIITVTVPYGTVLTELVPVISLSDKATVSPDSQVHQDFTTSVIYTVRAEDTSRVDYTVSVTTEESTEKELLSFIFRAEDNPELTKDITGVIDSETHTITVLVPYNTALTDLIPTIRISNKAIVSPGNQELHDFTAPVVYTVTAEDGTAQSYTVNVTIEENTEKELLDIVFTAADNPGLSKDVVGVIDKKTNAVTVGFPFGTSLTALIPSLNISSVASVSPNSQEVQDFTNPLVYEVTAEDGTSQNYLITAIVLPRTDREILVLFYQMNSGNTLGWDLNDETMDSWDGVSHVNGNVTLLLLNDRNITTLPPELGELNNLEFLFAISNDIDNIPNEIGSLQTLKFLYLSQNNINSIPSSIGNLTSLERLYLDHNMLGNIPLSLGNLTNLKDLHLNNNAITDIPSSIANLANLEDLYLNDNLITSIPSEIGNLGELSEFYVFNNSITSIPSSIGNLSNLEYLSLGYNAISSIPSSLGNLINLNTLFLQSNNLTTIPQEVCDLEINHDVLVFLDDDVECE